MLNNYFPSNFTPNKSQVYILKELAKAISQKQKYIIISAPTGAGKSLIAATLANYSKSCEPWYRDLVNSYQIYKIDQETGEFVYSNKVKESERFGSTTLTVTKSLQDQYYNTFPDFIKVLKGQSNYLCQVDTNFDVETAPCLYVPDMKQECYACNRCTYYNKRNEVATEKFSTLNYALFLNLPEPIKYRQFIICDESSELEDEIVKRFTVDIVYKRLDALKITYKRLNTDDSKKAFAWLQDIFIQLQEMYRSLVDASARNYKSKLKISDAEKVRMKACKQLILSLEKVIPNWHICDYCVEYSGNNVLFSPLRIDTITGCVFDYAEHVILMSATIIDPKKYAEELGIKDYYYIESPSEFDSARSPIYISQKFFVSHKNSKEVIPKLCQMAEQIVDEHPDDKGVIHTHSLDITRAVQGHFNYTKSRSRFLYRDNEIKNENILSLHKMSKTPTVLVSPSLTHGVDLKDDLSRFQIIFKTPYLPLQSKRIKQKFELDREWYTNKTLSTLVQTCGRSTRNADDYSITYILDGMAARLIMDNRNKLPKHFLDRIM